LWTAFFGVPFGASETGLDQLAMLGLMSAGIVIHMFWIHRAGELGAPIERGSRVFGALLAGMLVVAVAATATLARREIGRRGHVSRDHRSDDLFATAAKGERLLAGGSVRLLQLRTRRPVLLDVGTLDVLPYQPWAFPYAAHILREAYRIDLRNPPAGLAREGRLPPDVSRASWERLTREDWRRLRREFGITTVVTDGGWRMDLPSLMMGRGLQVFGID
jgi:hypothetical protein